MPFKMKKKIEKNVCLPDLKFSDPLLGLSTKMLSFNDSCYVSYIVHICLQDDGPPKPNRVSGWGEDAPRRRYSISLVQMSKKML